MLPKKLKRERERFDTGIKIKVLYQTYQKMKKLKASRSLFWERKTDNGAFGGAVWNEKRSPRKLYPSKVAYEEWRYEMIW